MYIRATFANRKWDPSAIELVTAWDEYQIDNNPEGYAKAVKEELDSWEDELLDVVTVDLKIDYPALAEMFEVKRMNVTKMEQVPE